MLHKEKNDSRYSFSLIDKRIQLLEYSARLEEHKRGIRTKYEFSTPQIFCSSCIRKADRMLKSLLDFNRVRLMVGVFVLLCEIETLE